MYKLHVVAALALLSFTFKLNALPIGEALPNLEIEKLGKMIMDSDGKRAYQPWHSESLKGRRWVIQYLSPRPATGKMNLALNYQLMDIDLPKKRCRTVNIVNLEEAYWGTHAIAKSEMFGGLKENLECIVIADETSAGQKAWQLPEKNNSTIVIDENGKVLFFHVGKLSDTQIKKIIELSAFNSD
jgi:YtfJ family uncharacterized protein